MLRLFLPTNYGGVIIQGFDHFRSKDNIPTEAVPPCLQQARRLDARAAITESTVFQGCCGCHLQRVVVLTEQHFLDYHPDHWDLYFIGRSFGYRNHQRRPHDFGPEWDESSHFSILHFALVPQQTYTLNECRQWGNWSYVGECNASIMRMDLEWLVTAFLGATPRPDEQHLHIHLFMDQIVDWNIQRQSFVAAEG